MREPKVDVRQMNLTNLEILQDAIRRDPMAACFRYGISAPRAAKVVELTPAQRARLIDAFGQQCVFRPAEQFWDALDESVVLPTCL